MIGARRRRRLSATTIVLVALAAAPRARADCVAVPFDHLFALAGASCSASGFFALGPYRPSPSPFNNAGLFAQGGGLIQAFGAVRITANPAISSYAAWSEGALSQIDLMAPVRITTSGTSSYGLSATDGGAITAGVVGTPSRVTTTGNGSIGAFASGAGSTITINDPSILTRGLAAPGAVATSGGGVVLNGGRVRTRRNGSFGVAALGSGSSITATDATIRTRGNVDVAGVQPVDVWVVGAGATATLANDKLLSSGVQGIGVLVEDGGTANLLGGSVSTTGSDAPAVVVNGAGSAAALGGVNVLNTVGNGAIGLFAEGGGVINATGPTVISTGNVSTSTGLSAFGVNADGAGSKIDLAATSVTTLGTSAYGFYANNGGTIAAPDSPGVTTAGNGSIGLYASGSGSSITVAGASIATHGASAPAVQADTSGLATLNGSSAVNTAGNGSIGLFATSGGVISATGPITISTLGTRSTPTGPSAFGVNADGAGSQINLAGTTITTAGAGAVGLYASQGGVISTANTLGVVVNGAAAGGVGANGSGSTATLKGATTIALTGSGDIGVLAATGGAISAQGPTSITISGALSTGAQALSGSVGASGALNVTTTQASSSAFALSGTSPSIVALGGGTISAAGNAIDFSGATNALATFDNFTFTNASGDLIFADPSTATVNFNNTIANAGLGDLINARNGSAMAFNASASTLTGAIRTDATSTTNVSLANGTTWNMTGASTMSSLNVGNSAVMFSSPSVGGFKTLTVGSYVGSGASLTLNTRLGGSNSPTDQLIVNSGSATGATALTIKNAGGVGAPTTGAGIPVVVAVNGGTTTPGAFHLANTPVVGGFEYTLGRDSANQDWYLTSSPASTLADVQGSLTALAKSRFAQMVTGRLLASLLIGANQQISGCDCGGGFGTVGSFGLGANGRWSLSDRLTLLAGASYDQFSADGADVNSAPIAAASLRYDLTDWGKSRPFFELGAAISPYMTVNYSRPYANGYVTSTGNGSAIDRSAAVFGRVGWVDRFTPIDEGAVLVDLVRGWQQEGGYSEPVTAVNPFAATVSTGVDSQYVARFGAQYTHLFFDRVEANVNAALAYGFDNRFGSPVYVIDFGPIAPYPLLNSAWAEFGGRLAYRFSPRLVADAFFLGTVGGEPGRTLHLGLGVRYAF
jgi:hypothetical protein